MITRELKKFFFSFQRSIKTVQQLAQLKSEERRNILKNLTDEQYEDVMKVMGKMPYVECKVRCEGRKE